MSVFLLVIICAAAALFVPLAAVFGLARFLFDHTLRLFALIESRPIIGEAAARLGLRPERRSLILGDRFFGRFRGFMASVGQRYRSSDADAPLGPYVSLVITLVAPRALADRLALGALDLGSGLGVLDDELDERPRSLRTFDRAFEEAFWVRGRQAGVAARLDAEMRRRLSALDLDVELSLAHDRLTAITRRPFILPRTIERLVESLAGVFGALLEETPTVPARLLANGLTDPEAAVRFHNLDLLLREHPTTDEAEQALRFAWQAKEAGIRYLAAIRLPGDEAARFLEETVLRDEETLTLRLMALRHLGRHAPSERILPIARALLDAEADDLTRAAVEILGRRQDHAALPALLALGRDVASSPLVRAAVARTVGLLGDSAGEDLLLELLRTSELDVKVAAATALGRAGTHRVLGPLGRVRTRYLGVPELSDAARQAIARIEARLGPAEAGHLSLAEPRRGEGAVSLAPRETGALALAAEGPREDEGAP